MKGKKQSVSLKKAKLKAILIANYKELFEPHPPPPPEK